MGQGQRTPRLAGFSFCASAQSGLRSASKSGLALDSLGQREGPRDVGTGKSKWPSHFAQSVHREGTQKLPRAVLGMPFGGLGVADCFLCHKAFDFHRLMCTHVGILGGLTIEHN